MTKKTVFTLLLTNIIALSLVIGSVSFCSAQTGLITFLTSDTTWTNSNTLTGPVVVATGATLTISGGVNVNLNGYYIYVNGTLKSSGTSSQKNLIYGGSITFNGSATANSAFENTIINSTITSTTPLTLKSNTINALLTMGDGSILNGNTINAPLTLANSCTLTNNYINATVTAGNNTAISSNRVYNLITAGNNSQVTNNVFDNNKPTTFYIMGYSYTSALKVESGSYVANNIINGSVTAASSTITNNTICGGGPFTDWVGRAEDSSSALQTSGSCTITQNTLWSTAGYGLLVQEAWNSPTYTVVSNNSIKNGVRVACDALIENNLLTKGGIQVGYIFVPAFNEISYGSGNSTIRGNIIADSDTGIGSVYDGGSTIIQGNLIRNVTTGISLNSKALSIQNNTIMNVTTAISLSTGTPQISYNNFVGYTQNSITLYNNPSGINAANNYWGSTDINAVNLTVHDFKYDLNLGVVNISPILSAANSNAPSASYSLQLPADTPGVPDPTTNPTANPTPTPTTQPTTNPTGTAQPTVNPTDSGTTPTPGTSSSPSASSSPEATPAIPEFQSWLIIALVAVVVAVALIYMAAKKKGQMPKQ